MIVSLLLAAGGIQFGTIRRLLTIDYFFIALLGLYPVLTLVSMAVFGIGDSSEFDTPSRFLLFIPFYVGLRCAPIGMHQIALGAAVGVLLTALYTLYHYMLTPAGSRIDVHDNQITFAQIAFLLAAIALLPTTLPTPGALRRKAFLVVMVAAGGLTVVLSQSRTVVLALPLIAVYAIAYRHRYALGKPEAVLGAVLLAAGLYLIWTSPALHYLAYLATELRQNISAIDHSTSSGIRLELWRSSAALIADHPWLGHGKGQFNAALNALPSAQSLPAHIREYTHAHNDLLNLWLELGIAGPISILALLIGTGWLGLKQNDDAGSRYLILLVVLTWLIFGVTQTQLAHQKITLLQLLLLSLGMAHGANLRYGVLGTDKPQ